MDTSLRPGRAAATRAGYWCECLARTPDHARVFWLGPHSAGSPRPALRWLRGRTRDVADQLDPAFALPARQWLGDEAEHLRALAALSRGELYSFTLADDSARFTLSAHPADPGGSSES